MHFFSQERKLYIGNILRIEKIQKGIRFLSSARLPFSEAVLYRTKIGHRGDVLSKSFWNDVFPFVMRNTAAGKKKEFTRDLTFNFPLMTHLFFSSSQ